MLYRDFGSTGWKVSAIGQGCWNIGNQWGEMSDETADRIIKTAYESGMNLFDVAESYGIPNGICEIRLGKAVKRFRDKIYLVSKIAWWGGRTGQNVPKTTADMIRGCGHACCGRLRTDYIDLMLCHDAGIEDPSIYIAGFDDLKSEGFIREYGISTDSVDVLKRFNDMSGGKCAAVECDYSLINRSPETELFPYCTEHSIAVLARGPMAMGLLAGKYDEDTVFTDAIRHKWNQGEENRADFEQKLASVKTILQTCPRTDLATTALRYVISHPLHPVAIPGATKPEQARSNALAGESVLSEEEVVRVNPDFSHTS